MTRLPVASRGELESALDRMEDRVAATLAADLDGFPHFADPETGTWTTTVDGFWTGGFWVGMLWLLAAMGRGERYRDAASAWCGKLQPKLATRSAFRAFLFRYGAALGADLCGDPRASDLAATAARGVAADFDPRLGLIPLGTEAEEAFGVGAAEASIDAMSAAALLLRAGRLGDEAAADAGLRHALRSAELFLRPDGSIIQSASIDPADGSVLRYYTHKGWSDGSTWTRAQAWGMLFFAAAAYGTGDAVLTRAATRASDWWLAQVPGDGVAWWDFDVPAGPDRLRDTSGTAIAAAALLRLAEITGEARYGDAARATVAALIERHLTPTERYPSSPPGMLVDGCFDPRTGTAVANELIWGSYFLLECLALLTGRLPLDRL